MSQSILIDIATTEGPSPVRAAWFDKEARQSAMVLFDQNHVPVGIDPHFDAFDRNLRRFLRGCGLGIAQDGLILEVERKIDSGQSWQLGLAVAHILLSQERLALRTDDAEVLYWVTGELGTSEWEAKPVEGITRKLDQSRARFSHLLSRGIKVEVLVPASNLEEAQREAPQGVTVRGIKSLENLVRELTRKPVTKRESPWPRLAAVGAIGAVLIGGGVWVVQSDMLGEGHFAGLFGASRITGGPPARPPTPLPITATRLTGSGSGVELAAADAPPETGAGAALKAAEGIALPPPPAGARMPKLRLAPEAEPERPPAAGRDLARPTAQERPLLPESAALSAEPAPGWHAAAAGPAALTPPGSAGGAVARPAPPEPQPMLTRLGSAPVASASGAVPTALDGVPTGEAPMQLASAAPLSALPAIFPPEPEPRRSTDPETSFTARPSSEAPEPDSGATAETGPEAAAETEPSVASRPGEAESTDDESETATRSPTSSDDNASESPADAIETDDATRTAATTPQTSSEAEPEPLSDPALRFALHQPPGGRSCFELSLARDFGGSTQILETRPVALAPGRDRVEITGAVCGIEVALQTAADDPRRAVLDYALEPGWIGGVSAQRSARGLRIDIEPWKLDGAVNLTITARWQGAGPEAPAGSLERRILLEPGPGLRK